MAASGRNLAVTKDGETYNKLSRPDDYLTSTQPPPSGSAVPIPAIPGSKRKHEQESASGTKRAKTDRNIPRPKGKPRAHEQFREPGVRSVLPGLEGEDQLTDESIDEAVAYLRSVRSEASAIPTLLVAPTDAHDASGDHGNDIRDSKNKPAVGPQRAVYNDGTWVALESESEGASEHWDGDAGDLDPQESCQWALVRRFCSLRSKLSALREHRPPSDKTASSRKSRRSNQFGKHHWAEAINREYPALETVTQMDESALYVALHGCTLALDRSTEISRQKSCWIWTLLALTGDFGTLDHERIGKIRDLGLAASRLAKRLYDDRSSEEQYASESETGYSGASNRATRNSSESALAIQDDHFTPDMNSDLESGEIAVSPGAELVLSGDETDTSYAAKERASERAFKEARAYLFAQLGDRLVQPAVPSSDTPTDAHPASNFPLLSRAEAERQRQELRNSKPQQEKVTSASASTDPAQTMSAGLESKPLAEKDLETKAAIDMILTVVAECYGQRDLLQFRKAW